MVRGKGSYYTPISVDGLVVEKRVESIEVSRDEARSNVAVRYTLSNPYGHPVTVPIQSALTMLYQYAQSDDDPRDPELHVVPATVTQHSNGELLYTGNETDAMLGTTAIQRHHLGTGIPNYRHPVAVRMTLVPGDSIELEAIARIPLRVQRMILVDAMVGPDQPYGIYPQLLEHPSNEGRTPPALRVYKGASFQNNPPHIQMPTAGRERTQRPRRLPSWIKAPRFAALQRLLRRSGKLWAYGIAIGATLLSLSVLLRVAIQGSMDLVVTEGVRTLVFAVLGFGTIVGAAAARRSFALVLGVSGLLGLVQIAVGVIGGTLPSSVLLTEAVMIPILYLGAAGVLALSRTLRAHTGVGMETNEQSR